MATNVASPMRGREGLRRASFLGIQVEALSMFELNAIVTEAIESGRRVIVANHNLHSIYLYHHDSKMRAFYAAADHIHVDGMAVVALARLLGIALRREHRVTFVDWMGPLASVAADHGWRVFYLGSRPGVAERGAEALRRCYPGLQIETAHGYFDPIRLCNSQWRCSSRLLCRCHCNSSTLGRTLWARVVVSPAGRAATVVVEVSGRAVVYCVQAGD
jgi:UDP-N-acetyl-D-mannosaminuronic acid transferase (WecB/TagA/CpsF family)